MWGWWKTRTTQTQCMQPIHLCKIHWHTNSHRCYEENKKRREWESKKREREREREFVKCVAVWFCRRDVGSIGSAWSIQGYGGKVFTLLGFKKKFPSLLFHFLSQQFYFLHLSLSVSVFYFVPFLDHFIRVSTFSLFFTRLSILLPANFSFRLSISLFLQSSQFVYPILHYLSQSFFFSHIC